MTRFDHCAVLVSLQLAERPPQAPYWKISAHYFKEAEPEIRRLWLEAPVGSSFFSKMRKVTRAYRQFCKQKAASFRTEEDRMKMELDTATGNMQSHPEDENLTARRGSIRIAFAAFQSQKVAGRRIRSRIRWRAKGTKCARGFSLS